MTEAFTVRLEPEIKQRMQSLADYRGQTLNVAVRRAIAAAVDEYERELKDAKKGKK